jgi:acrosin
MNGASLAGTLNGNSGSNTVDFSNNTNGKTFTLTGMGSTTGFKGAVSSLLTSGFDNINNLVGTNGSDTLVGLAQSSDWYIDDSGDSYVSGGRALTFSNIENLTGNSGADSFHWVDAGSLAGNIDGGTGANVVDYTAYTAGDITASLQNSKVTGLGGTFSNIGSLVGSDTTKTTLVGLDNTNSFSITGTNSGTVNSGFGFAKVENLTGGAGNDSFAFADGATLSGTIEGLAGTDVIDYRVYSTGLNIDLSTNTAVAGGVTTRVYDIENVVSGKGNDTIIGDAGDNVLTDVGGTDLFDGGAGNDTYVFLAGWGVGDVVTGISGIDTLDFSALAVPLTVNLDSGAFTVTDGIDSVSNTGYQIENILTGSGNDIFNINSTAVINLNGGTGNDAFNFNAGGSLTGTIDGGAGANTLNYTTYYAPVTYNLESGTVSGLTGTLASIQDFVGSAYSDTIVGQNSGTTFNVTGANSGNINGVLSFSNVENLKGGTGNDTFAVSGSASLSGSISGLSGSDTLSFNGYTSPVAVTILSANVNGFNGTTSVLGGGFNGIDSLNGTTGTDSLTGVDTSSTFNLSSTDTYILGSYSLAFSGFETLNGGSAADVFNITGTQPVSLYGNGGDDTFNFADAAILNGILDGGAGNDVLNFASYTTGRSITLTAASAVDGFDGSALVLTGGFRSINNLVGSTSSANDTLTGINAPAVFDLNALTYTSTNTLSFSGFDTLVGGSDADIFRVNASRSLNLDGGAGNDSFIFSGTNQLTGSIKGNTGTDLLDYQNYDADVTVNFAKGTATGVSAGISGIENFNGSLNHKNYIYGDDNDNVIVGGLSDDTMIGGKGNDTYVFANGWGHDTVIENSGEGNDTLDFSHVTSGGLTFTFNGTLVKVADGAGDLVTADSNVENFVGTNGNDTFVFTNGAVVTGKLDGGSGSNTLDYSGYGSSRSFILTGLGTINGFKGTEISILGGFDNIDTLIGTASNNDSLTGTNAASTWNLTTGPSDTYVSSGRTLTFSAIENLIGGSDADTFTFADKAVHNGSLNGGAGSDWLDYSAYTVGVTVNLTAGTATGVTGLISNIENISGSTADDILTGDANANSLKGNGGNDSLYGLGGADILNGGSGNDSLYGGSGDDTYVFDPNWASDAVFENTGEGNDTLDLSTVSANLTVTLSSETVTDGINLVAFTGNQIEKVQTGSGADTFTIDTNRDISLAGGNGADQFNFSDGVLLNGSIDGQAGEDVLNLSAYTTPRSVVLNGLGSVDGFAGQEAALTGSFTDIDSIIGTASTSDSFTGWDGTASFDLNGNVNYSSNSHDLDLSGFEDLNGGSGNDTFVIHGTRSSDLNGGAGNDTFTFLDNSVLNGVIDGGTGTNTLDYSNYTSSREFYLKGYGISTGYSGSEYDTIAAFTNINNIIGSAEVDALSGTNDAGTWKITGKDAGMYNSNSHQLTFSSIESLSGSGSNDTFAFADGATLTGSIDGRGGIDSLDFTAYSTGITADLRNGFVNVIMAGVTSFENVTGGRSNDVLTGNDEDNVLIGGDGDDELYGMGGNDNLYSGSGKNVLSGGDGDDFIWSEANSNNTLYGGDGYDTAYIASGSVYSVPLNDIENLTTPPNPNPTPIIVTGNGTTQAARENGHVLVVNVVSKETKLLTAEGYLAMILRLPEGNQVYFGFLNGETASLAYFDSFTLTDKLPDDTALVFGINVNLESNGLTDEQSKDGMVISFMVPAELDPKDLGIVFWNEKTNNWEEITSWYQQFDQMTTDDCIRGKQPERFGNKECLFTELNHTGSIGRIYAVAEYSGRYALVVKGKKAELANAADPIKLELSNGVEIEYSGANTGTLIAMPEENWNLAPVSDTEDAITTFTLYIRDGDKVSTDFGQSSTTISFKAKEGLSEDQQTIVHWNETTKTWETVENVTVVDGKVQAKVTEGGTYMLIKK